MSRVPVVLFACTQNAGRSQMAAALMRHLAGDRVEVRSAGSRPAARVHDNVVAVMAEVGVDLSGRTPRGLTEPDVREADVVVTMGCGDACPVLPGRRYLDWDVGDPAGKSLEDTRRIRDDIEARVRALLKELLGEGDR